MSATATGGTLHLQLLSRETGEGLFKLISFVTGFSEGNQCAYKLWSNGLILRGKSSTTELTKLCHEAKANLIEFRYKPRGGFPGFGRHLRLLEASLEISPHNEYWSPLTETSFEDSQMEGTRLSLFSLSQHVRYHNVDRYPSILDCCLSLDTSDAQLSYGGCFSAISEALENWGSPPIFYACARMGACGINVLKRMAPLAHKIRDLGEQFFDLYPIMAGSSSAIRELGRVVPSHRMKTFGRVGVIQLDESECNAANREKADNLLINTSSKKTS